MKSTDQIIKNVEEASEEILRLLVSRFPCLCIEHQEFGKFTAEQAIEIAGELVAHIRRSPEIREASEKIDWGK